MAKSDNNWIVWAVIIVAVIVAVFMFQDGALGQKTLEDHKKPADISEEESGTGLDMSFYDCPDSVLDEYSDSGVVPQDVLEEECRMVKTPEWFSTQSIIPIGDFSIVRRSSPPSCSVDSDCSGSSTNPDIMCWNSDCVLGNIDTISISTSVTNPSASELTYKNVAPVSASPSAFDSAIDKTAADLAPGNTQSFSAPGIIVSSFEGTTTTFSATIEGTNEYTGGTVSTSDSIDLVIESDPTGTFSVSVSNPAP